jgi:hypothetical protein
MFLPAINAVVAVTKLGQLMLPSNMAAVCFENRAENELGQVFNMKTGDEFI